MPRFARWVSEVDPAEAARGNRGDRRELRIASAAVETIGDAIARYFITFGGETSGLRGGRLTFTPTNFGHRFELERTRWTNDLEVSGIIDWRLPGGVIQSRVTLAQYGTKIGRLTITWRDTETRSMASVNGVINGKRVAARRTAP